MFALKASGLMIMKMIIICFFFCHINACIFSWVARFFQDDPNGWYVDSWIAAQGCTGDMGMEYRVALYWSVTTLTTVGYGDVIPTTNAERIYCMVSMVTGA